MNYLERPGGKIFYRMEGRGHRETLVLLHGLSADSAMFEPQVEYFKQCYQVLVPDLRGNGQSAVLDCPVDKVLGQQAADLLAILEHEKVNQAFIGGTSYGGVLTMLLMIQQPQLFKGAFLCDSFCATDLSPIMNTLAQTLAPLVRYAWFMKMTTLPIYRRWPQAQAYFKDLFSRIRPQESVLQRRAIQAIDYRQELSDCHLPTLLLAGDFSGKLVQMMKETEKHLSQVQSYVIEDSFDPSNLCQPAVFNQRLESFMQEVLEAEGQ